MSTIDYDDWKERQLSGRDSGEIVVDGTPNDSNNLGGRDDTSNLTSPLPPSPALMTNGVASASRALELPTADQDRTGRRVSFHVSPDDEPWRLLTPERIGFFNGDASQVRIWIHEAECIYALHVQDAKYRKQFVRLLPFCMAGVAKTWWSNLPMQERDGDMATSWPVWKLRLLEDFDEPMEKREKRFHSRRWKRGEEDIGKYYLEKTALCRAAYGRIEDVEKQLAPDAAAKMEMLESKIRQEIRHQAKLDIGWTFSEPTMQYGSLWYLRQIELQYETKRRR